VPSPPWEALWIEPTRCTEFTAPPLPLPARGYAWIDARADAPREWLPVLEQITGVRVLEEHLSDAENAAHPSYFDSTRDYEMIVFRGLAVQAPPDPDEPIRIRTHPSVFFLFPRCLVSIRPPDSRHAPALRLRLLEGGRHHRLPSRPEELMLRILNGMVDRYLELRQPLTTQLDDWQRELLDPRRSFSDWVALLEARRQLRGLENLSEEQLDALQEWRDERLDRRGDEERLGDWADATDDATAATGDAPLPALGDVLEVRVNDLVEHIERVRGHARRLESSVETAVQLHFSATAHRTNQIMRTLTVLTAIFMPLTLITGVFGMNFEFLPGIHSPGGFWWTLGTMALIAAGLVAFFRTRRYLEETGLRSRSGRRRRSRARGTRT
jgi:magnesium transporter